MELKEAYKLESLKKKLLEKGLPEVEDLAQKCADGVFEFLEESAAASSTPYDDMVVSLLKTLKPKLDDEIDKIDGKEG